MMMMALLALNKVVDYFEPFEFQDQGKEGCMDHVNVPLSPGDVSYIDTIRISILLYDQIIPLSTGMETVG